jgi:hypothetical protein
MVMVVIINDSGSIFDDQNINNRSYMNPETGGTLDEEELQPLRISQHLQKYGIHENDDNDKNNDLNLDDINP